MPAIHAIDKDLGLFVLRFSGRVTAPEVAAAISGLGELTKRAEPACSLLIFEGNTDLSEINPDEIKSFRDAATNLYRQMKVQRRAGAAVLDGSQDARIMMPFWNAICLTESDPDLHYEFFNDTAAAVDWLGLPRDAALAVAKRTEQPHD